MTIKPREVRWAISLFWASLAVGPIKTAMEWRHLKTLGPISFVLFTLIITIGFLSFLVWKLAIGKDWARITFMVLFVLGLPFGVPLIRAEFGRQPTVGILGVIQTMMQVAGLWLVFTAPGKNWFKTTTIVEIKQN